MSRSAKFPEGTIELAQQWLSKVSKASELKRVQCVLMWAQWLTSQEITTIVWYKSDVAVRKLWQRFKTEWEGVFTDLRWHNRGHAHWTKDEEKEFLDSFSKKAKKGAIITAWDIHRAHKEALGKDISISTSYELLHRHKWRKIDPRPEHPNHNPQKAQHFKEAFFPSGYDPHEHPIST